MNLKKLLCIFIGVAFSIYAFAQSLENGSGDPQASDFERNILSAFNAYPQRPCKILVYSGKDCFVEQGNPHSVIELFSVLEKRAQNFCLKKTKKKPA